MNRSSDRNLHRLLGCIAVAHSAAVIVLFFVSPWPSAPPWFERLWVGVATLWFFWPVVLVLHTGRSAVRVIVPLVLSLMLLALWYPLYSTIASPAFGLPQGCYLMPPSFVIYSTAYVRGRLDAHRDIRDGRIAVEVYGMGAGGLAGPLKERYQVEVRPVAACVVDERLMGHARGYNIVSAAEIRRRFGEDILDYSTGLPKNGLFADAQGKTK